MKKAISLILSIAVLLSCFAMPSYADSADFSLEAESAILIDLTTGKVLYEKNADDPHYPASTTKMMTVILALENLNLDNILYIDDEVHATTGSVLGLKREEEISAKDVLYATMVRSANDGAVALAKAVSGSVDNFSQVMNRKAKQLGCTGTNFVNPHGLHNDEHVSTARDLAIIGRYCMDQSEYSDTFRKIVQLTDYTVPATNKNEAYTVVNTNYLLNDEQDKNRIYVGNELRYCKYEGCIGVKTGYTSQAGGCLVAAAERDGTELLSVVLKSSTYGRFADSIKLLDWAFANFRTLQCTYAGSILEDTVQVKRGAFNKVGLKVQDDIFYTIPSEASDSIIHTKLTVSESVKAPVEAGQPLGKLEVFEGELKVGETDVVASESIEKGGVLSIFGVEDATAHRIFLWTEIVIGLFVASVTAWVIYKRREMKRKKAVKAARIKAQKEEEERRRQMWIKSYDEVRYGRHDDDDRY